MFESIFVSKISVYRESCFSQDLVCDIVTKKIFAKIRVTPHVVLKVFREAKSNCC